MDSTSLANRLKLLTLFRLLVAVVFLVATYFGLHDEVRFLAPAGRELVYGAITGLLLVCVVEAGLLERWHDDRRLSLLAYIHFISDALFATALVSLTGGVESIFTFLYSLAIINASIVLYRRGGIFTASVNTICIAIVALGQLDMLCEEFTALLAQTALAWQNHALQGDLASVLPSLVVNVLAFYGIAFLSSFLAEQLRSADVRAREHEAGLEALTNLHEAIVDSLDNGLVTVDSAHRIGFANDKACQILGRRQDDLILRPVGHVFPDIAHVLDNPDKARRSHSETTLQMLAGRKIFLRWTISPLRDPSGREVGYILLFSDITPLKEMEAQMERAERLAALGRMAANIAHEIRNPLASMSGSIQLLADSIEVNGAEQRLMDIVVRETEHLNQWISEFLEYARPRAPHLESLDVNELVTEVVEMLRYDERARDVEIGHTPTASGHLRGDRGRLRQVVWNLVLNAIQAAGPNGSVHITVDGTPDTLLLSVTDSGPGITPDNIQHVFEPFFTTKAKGTGLGLATVHRNVEEHEGTIQVESDPEKGGATFVVNLPRRVSPENAPTGPIVIGGPES